jgi:phage terminase small subunit
VQGAAGAFGSEGTQQIQTRFGDPFSRRCWHQFDNGVFSAMPILKNPRHERFAQGLAKGLSGKMAYVDAGFRARDHAAEVEGSKLLRKPEVAARVAELQAKHAKRVEVSVESIVAELDQLRDAALANKQVAAGVAAVIGKAKLLGLVIDKADVAATVRKPMREPGEVRQMSLEEWEQQFKPKRLIS